MKKGVWNFPFSNFTGLQGLNDAGVETYNMDRIDSLAKEICQNSIDAIQDGKKNVILEFNEWFIPRSEFPGYEDFLNTLKLEHSFWDEYQKNDRKVPDFYKRAINLFEKDNIRLLRISDYNTVGLTDSDKEYGGNWNSLVKATSVSDKPGSAGGSFGIGKSASFATSDVRTVFFATKDINGIEAFQGVARLSSFITKDNNEAYGIGFFGNPEKNRQLTECISLYDSYERQEPGTDLFIVAFNGGTDWEDALLVSLLNNFLFSFLNGKLVVRTDRYELNQTTVHAMMDKYMNHSKLNQNTKDYYEVIINENRIEQTLSMFEKDDVFLSLRFAKNLNRKVAIVRQNGMKIFDKGHISRAVSFSGVCRLNGNEVNKFFKLMENPSHDQWEPNRHSNPSKATDKREELFRFIRLAVKKVVEENRKQEVDAEGVGEYLPDFSEDGNVKEDEAITDNIRNELKAERKPPGNQGIATPIPAGKGGKPSDETGVEDPDGEDTVTDSGENGGNGGGDAGGGSTPGSKDPNGDRKIKKSSLVHPTFLKLIDLGGKYRLVFRIKEDMSTVQIKVTVSGETSHYKTKITEATHNGINCKIVQNQIRTGQIKSDEKNIVEFILEEQNAYALEVEIYETQSK